MSEFEKRDKPKQAEIYLDGMTHWFICPSCKEQIEFKAEFCNHCGQKISWKHKKRGKSK